MTKRLSIGEYHAGIYCGERLWKIQQWFKYYGIFRKVSNAFSIGPILFWKGKD